MKPDKVHILYHEKTNTTWANCKEWEERWKNESVSYGTVEVDIDNVFEMKRSMEKDGYVLVKDNPFKILNAASKILD